MMPVAKRPDKAPPAKSDAVNKEVAAGLKRVELDTTMCIDAGTASVAPTVASARDRSDTGDWLPNGR